MVSQIKTTCPYCGVGCGLVASTADDEITIAADPDHPANRGRICSKGAELGDTLSLDGRLLHPIVDGHRVSWEAALERVARAFEDSIAAHGPNSVAMYVSGQLLTEDYYVANKFMKGFVGSANIDTNSRLCMASTVAAQKRAFGADTVPGQYEDLELADLVVLVGSNLAWCHPVLHQRLLAARETRGTEIVVIDPRATATCNEADLHLPIKPGTDVLLWNALLRYLVENGVVDDEFLERHVDGFDEKVSATGELSIAEVSARTGLEATDVRCFFAMFANAEKVVSVFSQGVNQSTSGTDKVNAIINCHLATGRIGKPGAGPFSVTGQPNAMGGREVGGMANMLAAHMELDNDTHRRVVRSHWRAPRLASAPGLKAVDMFKAVRAGEIKALWIMATNPAASMPEALQVREALAKCPMVVISDVVAHNDTTQYADVLLPSLAWGEKEGSVTNSERCISRQRAFLKPPGECKADWWQIAQVARRMDHGSQFAYKAPGEIFDEHVELTTLENDGARDLDLGFLRDVDYADLEPQTWGARTTAGRFFGDGGFFTSNRKAKMVPTPFRAPAVAVSEASPFTLITGRVRDQWHTMTRSAKAPKLLTHVPGPTLAIHPQDAEQRGIANGYLAEIRNDLATVVMPVDVTDEVIRGTVFANMHWNDQFASRACIDALVPAKLDPISGQPEFKAVPVAVNPVAVDCFGYLLSTVKPKLDELTYWSAHPIENGWQVEFALPFTPDDMAEWLATSLSGLNFDDPQIEAFAYADSARGDGRCIRTRGERVLEIAFLSASPIDVSRDWLRTLVDTDLNNPFSALAGVPAEAEQDKGAIICACVGVGHHEITHALTNRGCSTVEDLNSALGAGGNCGSCRSELARLVADFAIAA